MLPILIDRNEIENAQRRFVAKLEERCNRQIRVKVGYKGGYEDCVIRWSPVLGLWFNSGRIVENRYWNPFGLSEDAPRENSMLSIVCEINPTVEGLNKQVQGVFMRDENGHIWLLHRGKIGGGKPGIGRQSFFENFRGETAEIAGEKVAVIGEIESLDFVDHVTSFVREVERIKALVT